MMSFTGQERQGGVCWGCSGDSRCSCRQRRGDKGRGCQCAMANGQWQEINRAETAAGSYLASSVWIRHIKGRVSKATLFMIHKKFLKIIDCITNYILLCALHCECGFIILNTWHALHLRSASFSDQLNTPLIFDSSECGGGSRIYHWLFSPVLSVQVVWRLCTYVTNA